MIISSSYELNDKIMKKIVLVVLCGFFFNSLNAQSFQNGGNYITLGFGLDPYGHAHNGNGYKHTAVGPIVLTYERGITELLGIGRIGVGGGVAQSFYTSKYAYSHPVWGYQYEEKYVRSRTSLVFRVAYHFDFGVEKMDVYAGVGGAMHFYSDKHSYTDPTDPNGLYTSRSSNIGGGHYVFGGIRYYFTESFGVYAEAGHGIYALNGGIVFAF